MVCFFADGRSERLRSISTFVCVKDVCTRERGTFSLTSFVVCACVFENYMGIYCMAPRPSKGPEAQKKCQGP